MVAWGSGGEYCGGDALCRGCAGEPGEGGSGGGGGGDRRCFGWTLSGERV